MTRAIFTTITGALGILLIIYGYYLLSVPPDTEFNEVVVRARVGMFSTIFGGVLVLSYIARK
ncbi:MAG: hypothetical protein HY759_06850 [Nitrospirae bacterium]|nr:hypothetical protein [Nitrospirota bacterium]